MTQTKVATTQQKAAVVKYKGEQITISFNDVKTLICPYATDQETVVFLKTCQSLNLNPFANEIYLIKYSENDKAATVIAIESYLKSAESNDNFNGHEAGIVLRDSGGKLEFREGSLLLPDEVEKLAGGYARVYRKDREKSFYMAVNRAECLKYTKNGNLTKFWAKDKQPMMLRKTALKRALVEAFPSLFAGTMSTAEVADTTEAEYREMSEGELPPAYEKINGEKNWKRFWAKVKSELGLTTEQARELLQVESIKAELIDTGWTMEKIWDELVIALKLQKAIEVKPERAQVVDTKTGEIITQEEDLFGEGEEKTGVAAPAEAEIEQPTGTAAPAKPKRDPKSIKTVNDLLRACNQDFKMQPKQVYAELNISGPKEIADPAEAYQRIAAVRG
ncbi:hypothetical protein ES705_31675 [subsurface metagenome]